MCICGQFGPNIDIFGPFAAMPDQKTMGTRCVVGFSVMWVPKLLFFPVKLRILAQKRPNFAQNMLSWAHVCPAGSFGALLVGGCGARAVSRKTPTRFMIFHILVYVVRQ